MTSAGGLRAAWPRAAELPAALLLSGPAGGVRAGAAVAAGQRVRRRRHLRHGRHVAPTCAWCSAACPSRRRAGWSAGFPIRLPSLDVHTIGAGGGSIARIDPGGALVVGPESAGAEPGPACYGRGGERPDRHRRRPRRRAHPGRRRLPGPGRARRRRRPQALERAGVDAEGVIAVVDANMERALRAVSVERGVDPRGLALVAFGGAGPLHACALADALGMAAVIVPPRAGVLSAVGLLASPRQRELVRSWPTPVDSRRAWPTALAALAAEAARSVGAGADVGHVVDCRYAGPEPRAHRARRSTTFPAEHERRNGYARPGCAGRGGGAAGPGPARRAARRRRPRRRSTVTPAVGPDRHRRARLHDLGARGLAGRGRGGRGAGAAEETGERRSAEQGERGDHERDRRRLAGQQPRDERPGLGTEPRLRAWHRTGDSCASSRAARSCLVATSAQPTGGNRLISVSAFSRPSVCSAAMYSCVGHLRQRALFRPSSDRSTGRRTRPALDGTVGSVPRVYDGESRPGVAPGADLPADRRGRGDGRRAAAGGVQPQHQGAGRLLGRAVHRRRRAARAGRAHPRAPRLDAGVGAGRHRRLRATARPGRAGRRSTTRSPAAPTSTTSPWWRRATVDGRLVGWAANRAHHADVGGAAPGSIPADATEIHAGGPAHPAGAADRRGAGHPVRQLPHAGRAGAATSTPRSAPTWSASPGWPTSSPAARRSTRSSTTASAGCGPRWPRCPTARGRSPT